MRITILTLIVRAIKYSSHLLSNHKGNSQVSALTAGTVVAVGLTGAGMVATKYVTDRQKEINQAEQMKLNEDAARKLKDKVTLRKDISSGVWASDWQIKTNGCPGGAPYCLSGPDIGTSSQIAIRPTEIRNLSSVDIDKLFNNIDSSTQSLLNTSSASDVNPVNFTITGYRAPQGEVIEVPGSGKGWLTVQTADGMIAEITLDALPPAPTCTLTSQRVGVTNACTVILTSRGEVNPGPYSGFNEGANTRTCSVSSSTIFNATVTGVGGSTICEPATQDKVADAECGIFTVGRINNTNQCQVTLTAKVPSVVSQYRVNGSVLAPSYTCDPYSPPRFSGSLLGVNGTEVSCGQQQAPEAAPTCQNFTVTRKENEPGKCIASMTSQGTIIERWINEVPQAGAGPWTVNCSTLSSTSFSARIKSAGGETTCNPISIEAVPPTSCTFTASRITNDRCRITVRSSGGPMNRDYPRLGYRYDMFGPYARTEVAWQPEQSLSLTNGIASLDVPCDSMRTNYFAAVGFGPGDAQRKNCTSSDPGHIGGGVVRILPNASECRFTANRDPQNLSVCKVTLSRQGGPFSDLFPLLSSIREGSSSWVTQQTFPQWDGTKGTYTTACATDGDFQFVVDAHGPGNPIGYRCTPESVDPALMVAGNALRVTRVLPPKCSSLAASRLSPTSDQCRLTFKLAADSGPLATPRPAPQIQKDRSLASLSNNLGWSGDTWEGNIYCPTQSAGEFSATVAGLSGATATCTAPQIAPVPPTQCNFSASRKTGEPGTCVVSVSSTGGPLSTGYPILGHAIDGAWQAQRAISPWNGSSSSMEIPCDIAKTHTLVTTVKGPGDNQEKNCSGGNHLGQLEVTPLPPVCSGITASRTTPSAETCTVQITKTDQSGPVSQVVINNQATAGSWSGNTWTGTVPCATSGATLTGALKDTKGNLTTCGTDSVSAGVCLANASGGLVTEIIESPSKKFRVHTFSSVGNNSFTVHKNCPMEVLVVAGGGGAGVGRAAGGGGAGGVLHQTGFNFPNLGSYNITVGNGGGATGHGQNSAISNLLVAIGGGRGGNGEGQANQSGGAGGSGGGGGFKGCWGGAAGTPGQGHAGGNNRCGNWISGGGGGGAGGVGQAGHGANRGTGGNGGSGRAIAITGSTLSYGGGGGGRGQHDGSSGGSGGGGNGGREANGTNGLPNTGGGGGGSNGAGGSGVVIIKYEIEWAPIPPPIAITQPVDRATLEGDSRHNYFTTPTFTFVAQSPSGMALNYRWYRKEKNQMDWVELPSSIPSSSESTLTLTSLRLVRDHGAQFKCKAFYPGAGEIWSEPATLTILGGWRNAGGGSCDDVCARGGHGFIPKNSPDGTNCTSGETVPWSAWDSGNVSWNWGCWDGCAGGKGCHTNRCRAGRWEPSIPNVRWGYCYAPDQPRDNNNTDITVGCYCGPP